MRSLIILILSCIACGAAISPLRNPGVTLPRTETAGGGGGTDWTADSSFVAWWRFESGSIEQDSSGKGNHIDDDGTDDPPTADTGDFIGGAASGDYEDGGTDDISALTYSNASADFVGNGTGDGEITIAGWYKPESTLATQYFFITNPANALRGYVVSGNTISINVEGQIATSTDTLTDGVWSFIAFVYSDSGDTLSTYIRDQGEGSSHWAQSAGISAPGTLNDASAGTFMFGGLSVGGGFSLDGKAEEWAVFNGKAFSQAELDAVYTNGWDGDGW